MILHFPRKIKELLALLGLILTLIPQTHAQNRANHWYFYTKAGLVFNGGIASPATTGRVEDYIEPVGDWKEGVSSISDSIGNLLFYTDGVSIWNNIHYFMPNAQNLKGSTSSAQGALIVPSLANKKRYYVFSLGDITGVYNNNTGLHYSLVDMTLQNGLGDVLPNVKNKPLYPSVSFSEKLAAVQSMDLDTYWVVCNKRGTNTLFAFSITQNGLSNSYVPSNTGSPIIGVDDGVGSLVFSPSGNYLAQTFGHSQKVEIYHFNQQTGSINVAYSISSYLLKDAYGIMFSPNEEYLYVSAGRDIPNSTHQTPKVLQVDLRSKNQNQINSSITLLYTYPSNPNSNRYLCPGTMQIGPDGKIYVAIHGESALGVIPSPNLPAPDCGYLPFGQPLGGREGSMALPNMVANFTVGCDYLPSISLNPDTTLCFGDTLAITPQDLFTAVSWQDGSQDRTFVVTQPGAYTAQIDRRGCITYDTVIISYYPEIHNDLGPDVLLCPGETMILNSQEAGAQYLWQDESTETIHLAKEAGTYWLQTTQGLCSLRDSMNLSFEELPTLDLGRDTTIYSVDALTIDATVEDVSAIYLWNDGLSTPQREITQTGHYRMEVEINGCYVRDSIQIEVVDLIIPNLITPNGDGINERFVIRDSGFERWKLDIFDRYGRPVYQSLDYQDEWSGIGVREGTYYYALVDQITGRVFQGWVLVMR